MSVAIRLQRGGAKKRPYYRIVVTDKRNARDGKFIEKVGTFDPMLPRENTKRVTLVSDRLKYWLSVGAQPSERVQGFLFTAGLVDSAVAVAHRPAKERKNKAHKTRAELRVEAVEAAKAQAAAEAAAAAAAPAVVEEAPAQAAQA